MKRHNIITQHIPLQLLHKATNVDIIMPLYHIVSNHNVVHVKHLYKYKNVKLFKLDLDYLIKNYNPMSLFDIIIADNKNKKMPGKKFFLSFDDGLREIYDYVAPLLLEKGIPATFFVNSDFIDNKKMCFQHKASILADYLVANDSPQIHGQVKSILQDTLKTLGIDNVKECILSISYKQSHVLDSIAELLSVDLNAYLKKERPYLTTSQINKLIESGFTIGAHSIDHPHYGALCLHDQLRQTMESVTCIKNTFSLDYGAFAFPNTDANISKDFFYRLFDTGLVDVSFGNFGILHDEVEHHYQRFNAEKRLLPIKNEISYQLTRMAYKTIVNDQIVRC